MKRFLTILGAVLLVAVLAAPQAVAITVSYTMPSFTSTNGYPLEIAPTAVYFDPIEGFEATGAVVTVYSYSGSVGSEDYAGWVIKGANQPKLTAGGLSVQTNYFKTLTSTNADHGVSIGLPLGDILVDVGGVGHKVARRGLYIGCTNTLVGRGGVVSITVAYEHL